MGNKSVALFGSHRMCEVKVNKTNTMFLVNKTNHMPNTFTLIGSREINP